MLIIGMLKEESKTPWQLQNTINEARRLFKRMEFEFYIVSENVEIKTIGLNLVLLYFSKFKLLCSYQSIFDSLPFFSPF